MGLRLSLLCPEDKFALPQLRELHKLQLQGGGKCPQLSQAVSVLEACQPAAQQPEKVLEEAPAKAGQQEQSNAAALAQLPQPLMKLRSEAEIAASQQQQEHIGMLLMQMLDSSRPATLPGLPSLM